MIRSFVIKNVFNQKFVLYSGLFIFAFIYFYLIVTTDRLPNIYQARDIQNTLRLLGGESLWAGPNLLGGGNAPGPFYYWLLALPLGLFQSWQVLPVYAIFLAALAGVTLFHIMQRNFSEAEAYFTFLFFLNSFVIQKNLINLWNPSYLYLFQVILIGLFFNPKKLPFKFLVAGFLLLALTIQIHLMQLLFAVAIVFSFVKLKLDFSYPKLLLLAGAFFLPFVPFFLHSTVESGQTAYTQTFLKPLYDLFIATNAGSIKNFIDNFISFFKNNLAYDLFFFSNLLFFAFYLGRAEFSNYFLKSLLITSTFMLIWVCDNPSLIRYMVPFSLVFCIFLGRVFQQVIAMSHRLRYWIGGVLFSLLVNVYLRRNQFNGINAELVIMVLVSCGLVLWSLSKSIQIRKTGLISLMFIVTSVGLILKANSFAIILPVNSEVESYSDFGNIASENKSDTTELLKIIVKNTSWNYSQFRQKSFVLGFSRETDLSLIYNSIYESIKKSDISKSFDGVIVVRKSMLNQNKQTSFKWPLAAGILPEFVKELFNKNRIECRLQLQNEKFTLCFYKALEEPTYLKLNNLGYAYQPHSKSKSTPDLIRGLNRVGLGAYLIYLNPCDELTDECAIYFKIEIHGNRLHFAAYGNPIGVSDVAVSPTLVAQFKNIKLTVQCSGLNDQFINIGQIGFEKSRGAFLDPFETAIEIQCQGPAAITLTGSHTFYRRVSVRAEQTDFEYILNM